MTKELYAFLLAGILVGADIAPALGHDASGRPDIMRQNQLRAQPRGRLQVPLVPYVDSVPWLNSRFTSKGAKIDFLLAPKFETRGPFLAERIVPPLSMASVAGSHGATAAVEW